MTTFQVDRRDPKIRRAMVAVIKPRKQEKRIFRSFRLRPDLVEMLEQIAAQTGESKTYVLESLLDYAIEAYEKEKKGTRGIKGKK